MPPTLQQLGLDKLSDEDCLAVAEAIWDSVARRAENASLSPARREELERRLADSIARPAAVSPWEVIKARALARARLTPPVEEFPEPGTEAWGVMNRPRGELIHKKNRGGLSAEEAAEYERLQRLTQAALERAFPAPMVGADKLARIEARLGEAAE